MGMFDDVDFEMNCPKCGARVADFQSKDGECSMNKVKPWTVNHFYTACPSCRAWIEYRRKPSKGDTNWLDNYEMTVRDKI